MIPFRRALLLDFYMLAEVCILIASLFIASWFVTYKDGLLTFKEFFFMRVSVFNLVICVSMIILWHIIFKGFKLYMSRRLDGPHQEWKDIIKATSLGMCFFALFGFFFNIEAFTPLFITVAWLLSTLFTLLFRATLRFYLKRLRIRGKNLRFVLIVGTNKRAYDFARLIEEKKELGYRLVGFIDKDIYLSNENVNLLGLLKDLSSIIKDLVIDEIVIALPIKSCYEEIEAIIHKSEEQGITVKYLSNFFNTRFQVREEMFEDFLVMTLFSVSPDSWGRLAKRVSDFSVGLMLAILMSPFMICIALAIKFDSLGPVLFIQNRIGQNKRIFRLYKFRTMRTDAEAMQLELENINEMDGPVFKIRNDPRNLIAL